MHQLLLLALFAQDDLERVVHLLQPHTAQGVQEIATVLRVITGLPHLNSDGDAKTVTFRGSAEQGTLAGWLLQQFDSASVNSASFTAGLPETNENSVHFFRLQHTPPGRDLQQLATVVRSLSDLRHLMSSGTQSALVVRGTPAQARLANWLVTQLDQPRTGTPPPVDFRPAASADDIARVIHLPRSISEKQMQELAVLIRSSTQIRRLFIYSPNGVLLIRGSAAQLAQAEQLLNQGRL